MIYGYIRVSSDKQTVENQRFEIWHSPQSEYYGSDGGFDLDTTLAQDPELEIINR